MISSFKEVTEWIYESTGIEIPGETIRFDIYTNPRGAISVQGKIGYRGPLRPGGDLPRIKLDLTNDEILVLEPVSRRVHHPYSDDPYEGIHINCYCFEEVFAEKIRALAERERPRDLYDVVHLYRHNEIISDREVVLSTLEEKCRFKEIEMPNMGILEGKPEREELESEWRNMLAHQLPALPSFEQFWNELPEVFDWLYRAVERAAPPSIPLRGEAVDETWHAPAMAQAWSTTTPLEIIRFAAANRLCVDLAYQGRNRLIEPYSLRRTQAGNLLLYAVKHETGEDRSYRVDRIQGAEVTREPFKPRYSVELTASGPISAPPTAHKTTVRGSGGFSSRQGPTYVIECPYCARRFNRKTNNPRLNPHKDKTGFPCSGRIGHMVDVRY